MPAIRDLDPGASPAHFFGAEVRRARVAADMTLADLAATVPCDASTVSRIEAGTLSPARRFADACDEAFPNMAGWFSRFCHDSRTWGRAAPALVPGLGGDRSPGHGDPLVGAAAGPRAAADPGLRAGRAGLGTR
jgi:hypothetical protein